LVQNSLKADVFGGEIDFRDNLETSVKKKYNGK
jgi:hypothetical protein